LHNLKVSATAFQRQEKHSQLYILEDSKNNKEAVNSSISSETKQVYTFPCEKEERQK